MEHLSSEDAGLVSKTDLAVMITIAPEVAESVGKEADLENWKQVSTYIKDKRMEIFEHWGLVKSLRQILGVGLITG